MSPSWSGHHGTRRWNHEKRDWEDTEPGPSTSPSPVSAVTHYDSRYSGNNYTPSYPGYPGYQGGYKGYQSGEYKDWEKYKDVRPWDNLDRERWPKTWFELIKLYHDDRWATGKHISDMRYYHRIRGIEAQLDEDLRVVSTPVKSTSSPTPPPSPPKVQYCAWKRYCTEGGEASNDLCENCSEKEGQGYAG